MMIPPILAHAGGIDEIAVMAVPFVIYFVYRAIDNRRALREDADLQADQPEDPDPAA